MSTLNEDHSKNLHALLDNLSRVIQGKDDKIELFVLGIAAGGHMLIEDIPGVGKTTLARALAKSIGGQFSRIQFTPDLLPNDITGINIFQPATGNFLFRKGPIFSNIVLGDEINRASARTQSAMLEAMGDEHVTIDGNTLPLPKPFIVLATQNPIEYHGTYPLPEAQLDRFMLQVDLGYPPAAIEQALIVNRTRKDPVEDIATIMSLEILNDICMHVDRIKIENSVSQYLLQIITATRQHPSIRLGVSTRGSLLYSRIVRARAMFQGRDFVIPEDVKTLAIPALSHRILLNNKAQQGGNASTAIIEEILASIPVPR